MHTIYQTYIGLSIVNLCVVFGLLMCYAIFEVIHLATSGEKIKQLRSDRGLTQRQLSEKSGVIETTIRKYELGTQNPKMENLQKLAGALGVPAYTLIDEPEVVEVQRNFFWRTDLDEKLKQVGCSVGFYEEDAYIWINYPDGTLEVTEEELKELNENTDSFMRFKLEELKEKRKDRFKLEK